MATLPVLRVDSHYPCAKHAEISDVALYSFTLMIKSLAALPASIVAAMEIAIWQPASDRLA